jgi:hypothetical protein
VVRVIKNGRPVPGQVVSFVVADSSTGINPYDGWQAAPGGLGKLFAGTSITDREGYARDYWTLGFRVGTQNVEVRAVDPRSGEKKVFARFSAVAVSGDGMIPQGVDFYVDPMRPGAVVLPSPGVMVLDQFGNPVPGTSVAFHVEAGGGSLTGSVAVSGSDGIARVGSWTLGPTATVNTLNAVIVGRSDYSMGFEVLALEADRCLGSCAGTRLERTPLECFRPSDFLGFEYARSQIESAGPSCPAGTHVRGMEIESHLGCLRVPVAYCAP